MSSITNGEFTRTVPSGHPIAPWLILGPFYRDYSATVEGLTLFERAGATVGQATMESVLQEAQVLLQAAPYEGQEDVFLGESRRWDLVRRPEKYLAWGEYHISNHLGAAFLSTVVMPSRAGGRQWQLATELRCRAVVVLNGKVVFDSAGSQPGARPDLYTFSAELGEGENRLTVGLFRLGRMARVGLQLTVLDDDVQVHVPLAPGVSNGLRQKVEASVQSLRLESDLFYPEHTIGVVVEQLAGEDVSLRLRLLSATGEVIYEVTPTTSGLARLCQGEDLADGSYGIVCAWLDGNDEMLTSTEYAVRKVTPLESLPGYEHTRARAQRLLVHFAEPGPPPGHRPDIWREVARYALERYGEVDEEQIGATCAFIAARKDCADFVIQGVLRLMVWEQEAQRLSAGLNALMKETILGFKYWVDEPGDTVMYMGSENHRLLFHVAEWMAGQLFPLEEFTNSRQRGLYHATKGRMYITEWLRQRGRFGFDEWHSNAYFPICIAPLLNVHDFAIGEDYKLRQMAAAVLDYMFFILAADTLKGVLGTTHGRSYGRYIKDPDFEGTAATCWLLYGTGSLVQGVDGMAPVSLATSSYQVPEILHKIAHDDQAVVESKQRQGILRGSERHADFVVYRTPDYQLSAVQDHRKGEYESSTHVAQVTLNNKAVIFWSAPHTSGEGSGLRPDYWSGHTVLPRAIQYRNVLALTWQLRGFAWMTHCFFEQARFDQVRFQDKWAFARVGSGYVGIYAQHGYEIGKVGQYAGRELICTAAENTWLVECGREADWGSFGRFVEALTAATISADGDTLTYESPSIGRFVTSWDGIPTVNGAPIQLRGYPLVESPWAHSRFGSGELVISYGDDVHEVWFNQ
jgi:hypothetical protein